MKVVDCVDAEGRGKVAYTFHEDVLYFMRRGVSDVDVILKTIAANEMVDTAAFTEVVEVVTHILGYNIKLVGDAAAPHFYRVGYKTPPRAVYNTLQGLFNQTEIS